MGQKHPTPLQSPSIPPQNLKIINQYELCQVVTTSTNVQYTIRQLSFNSYESLQKCLMLLGKIQKKQFAALTNLLYVQQKIIEHMCGAQYKIRMFFQHSGFTIVDQIDARHQQGGEKNGKMCFQRVDAWKIVIGCVRALRQAKDMLQQLPQQQCLAHPLFIHPDRILLLPPQSNLKLANPLTISPYNRLQHRANTYYSPEKLLDFDYPEDQKSSIFELGITLMHVFLLRDCKSIYNGFQVKQQQIDNLIQEIYKIYQDQTLCELLFKMTRNYRGSRAGLRDCEEVVELIEAGLEEHKKEQNIKRKQQQQQQQKQKYEQEQDMIEASCRGRKIDKDCVFVSRYGESSRKMGSTNKFKQGNMTQNSLNIELSQQQNKQNISHNINKSESLKYSHSYHNSPQYKPHPLLTSSRNNPNRNPPNRNPHPNSSRYASKPQHYQQQQQQVSHLFSSQHLDTKQQPVVSMGSMGSLRKESCVVTNQIPFYNIQMINSRNFGMGVASESVGHRISVNNAKQSYCYGNQLSQGLLPSTREHPSPTPTPNNPLRKRTQFNKKHQKPQTQLQRFRIEDIQQLQPYQQQNCGNKLDNLEMLAEQ